MAEMLKAAQTKPAHTKGHPCGPIAYWGAGVPECALWEEGVGENFEGKIHHEEYLPLSAHILLQIKQINRRNKTRAQT